MNSTRKIYEDQHCALTGLLTLCINKNLLQIIFFFVSYTTKNKKYEKKSSNQS